MSIKESIKEIYYVALYHEQYTKDGLIPADWIVDKTREILKKVK